MIIDEIQKLEDLYINNKRELLKEFLNFCVSLTKEKYLSHVLILSSNTIFIERIYNDAKLKETSRFKKIDHLSKEKVQEWLCIEEGWSDFLMYIKLYQAMCFFSTHTDLGRREGRSLLVVFLFGELKNSSVAITGNRRGFLFGK